MRAPLILAGLLLSGAGLPVARAAADAGEHWVGSWASAQQLNIGDAPEWLRQPPKRADARPSPIPPFPDHLEQQTVRMVVRLSLGGRQIRLQLSNAIGAGTVRIDATHVAVRTQSGEVRAGSDRKVTFGGKGVVAMPAGAMVVSDPVDLRVLPLTELFVSVYVSGAVSPLTVHPLGLHTTYVAKGDVTAESALHGTVENRSYFWLTGVDVLAPSHAGAIVAFGDSITDGFATTPDANRAWPAVLSGLLYARGSGKDRAVLNLGISGNRLLHDGAGTNALARFDRDVLARSGVCWVVLLEGINDISFPAIPAAPPTERVTRDDLVEAYQQLAERAHLHGIKVLGATILPWEGVWTYNEDAEKLRQEVNKWIRRAPDFDGIVDFDALLRDPSDPRKLLPRFDSGDHVHPNDAGNEAMARAVEQFLSGH